MSRTLALVENGMKALALRSRGAQVRGAAREIGVRRSAARAELKEHTIGRPTSGASSGARAHRTVSLVATLGLFWPMLSAWGDIVAVPSSGIAVIALFGGGLWLVCAIATAEDEAALARLDIAVLGLGLLVLIAYSAAKLQVSSGYGTDEAAFEQQAAQLVLHGHNPYGANLLSSLSAFAVPSRYATYTMSGGMVSTVGYPAVPLLVTAAFVKLTGGGQAVPIADLVVLMVATVVLFKALPSGWRALAVVICVGFPILSSFALAGMNTIIMMAALLVAAIGWTHTGESGAMDRRDRIRAVALGLALASNQLSWFIAPFLLTGIYLVRRGNLEPLKAAAVTARYLAIAVATFVVINLPFIVWDPGAWFHGVLAPITQHAIPYGQGVVGLTLFLHLGGGAVDAYSYAAGFVYIALLILYAAHFRRFGRCCFIFPPVALFVSGRSLAGYWVMLIAVIIVAVVTADDKAIREAAQLRLPRVWLGRRLPSRVAVPALFLPAAICLVVALGTPQPLTMRVLDAQSSTPLRSVWRLRVAVHNGTDAVLHPHFATNAAGQATAFWNIKGGPPALEPHASATYVLAAPDEGSMQPNGTPFLVDAVTDGPRTISSTATFTQLGPVPGNW